MTPSGYCSCQVLCHRCGHEWIYMGIRLASLTRTRKPVKVECPHCHAKPILDPKNAV